MASERRNTRRKKIDNSHQENKVPTLRGATPKQKEYLTALQSSPQVFAIGPAGTGKTYLPTAYAADLLREKTINKIILTRPNVPAGPSLGFFPGELEEKMAPWVVPFLDVIKERMRPGEVEYHTKVKNIEVVPFEVMRGRTFHNSYVIVDEAQNLTPNEMYMVLTRIGEDSRLVITGDIRQKDIKGNSGLSEAIERIEKFKIPVGVIQFSIDDVVRSGICAEWVKAWDNN